MHIIYIIGFYNLKNRTEINIRTGNSNSDSRYLELLYVYGY